MSKKPTMPDVGEIPIPYGKKAVQLDHVSVIGNGKTLQLIVYPNEQLLAHMRDWRFVGAAFTYNGSAIDGLKLTKADSGFNMRKVDGRRAHLYIPLEAVAVDSIGDPDPDELGDIKGTTVTDDDAVVFALPKVIAGSSKRHFRISRT